jgi:hypothetical protein
MTKRLTAYGSVVILLMGLQGCASLNEKALRLFSARAKSIAIVRGQVLTGHIDLLPDRTGTASLAADGESPVRCVGHLRYTGSSSGTLDLRCSDASNIAMQFSAMTEISGYAYGQTSSDDASLAYGLSEVDATAILRPPSGKRLVSRSGGGLELQ